MKKSVASFLLLLTFALVAVGAQSAKPWYSAKLESLGFTVFAKPLAVDDFVVPSLAGPNGKLSDQKGKILLLNFWATWCPPCREEMPALDLLWKGMKGKSFSLMGVSVGEEEKTVRDFIGKNKYSYPIYLDGTGSLGAAFSARSIPTTYIIDKYGLVIAGKVGGADYGSAAAIAIFTELASR